MRKTWFRLTALIMFLLICSGSGYAVHLLTYNFVYPGVCLEGMDMGGRSRAEVAALLAAWKKDRMAKTVTVYNADTRIKVESAQVDFDLDTDETADEIYNYGRVGSWWERIKKIRKAKEEPYNVVLKVKYNKDKLESLLEGWHRIIDKQPKNAALSITTGGIVPHELGRKLDDDTLRPALLGAFAQGGVAAIPLPVIPLHPEITTDDISRTGIRKVVSLYSTLLNSKDANRTANVKKAVDKINGLMLYPGEMFSFNKVVGPREVALGFKEALEIVDGEFVTGVGGGICQVSSTLYNAVLLADLAIKERYNHSKPLSYVPLGRDATVAYNMLDFKFANNSGMPLMIVAEVLGNKLVVGIFGQHKLNKQVDILAVNQEVIPPTIVKKQDENLYIGESKVEKEGHPGYYVTTIRVISSKGREIKREVLAKDKYLPEDTIVKVGTQVPPLVQKQGSNIVRSAGF